jgi:hypothetical protein
LLCNHSNFSPPINHVKYDRRLEGEKTALEQEVEELQKKFEAFEQRRIDVEGKLTNQSENFLASTG